MLRRNNPVIARRTAGARNGQENNTDRSSVNATQCWINRYRNRRYYWPTAKSSSQHTHACKEGEKEMSEKEITEELKDIKKLLILHLLASSVRAAEIAEILDMKESNFSRDFKTRKLIKRLKAKAEPRD